MNERIKELAKQSGLIQYDTDSKMNDVEKFAELIVQKCANVCQNDDDSARILDAFGVEE
jgi:hypothetical protein